MRGKEKMRKKERNHDSEKNGCYFTTASAAFLAMYHRTSAPFRNAAPEPEMTAHLWRGGCISGGLLTIQSADRE